MCVKKKRVDIFKTDIGYAIRIDGEYAGSCVKFNEPEKPYLFSEPFSPFGFRGDSVQECIENYFSSLSPAGADM